MPSLQQIRATGGRGSMVRVEDLNAARLPSLYASRSQAIANQEMDLAQEGLALRQRESEMQNQQGNTALLTQGLGTAVSGAGLLETAYPGSLSSIGSKFLSGFSSAPAAAAPAVAPALATAAGPAAGALPGGTGLAAAYPLFGGASEASLGAAAPAALSTTGPSSVAATASGIAAAPAAAEVAGATVAPTIASTTGATAGAAAGGAGGATFGAALGPAGIGFGLGTLAGKPLGKLFGLKGRVGGAAGGAVSGAIGGAAAGTFLFPGIGTALGAVLGGISGAIGGAVSMIASVVYGWDHPATQLAEEYRRRYVGQTTYLGYRLFGATMVSHMEAHPILKPLVQDLIVDPCVRGMAARLLGLPHVALWEQAYLDVWLRSSHDVGRRAINTRKNLMTSKQMRQLKKGA